MCRWPIQQHLAVLRVSKQICAESKESFDQRWALVCSSQVDLVKKVIDAPPAILENVRTLALSLDDKLFLGGNAPSGAKTSLIELAADKSLQGAAAECYFQDLQFFVSYLGWLPNISDLSIKRSEISSTIRPPKTYLVSLLVWLSNNYGFVERLNLTVNTVSLAAISAFTNLQALSFVDNTPTPEGDMITLVERLGRLEELTVVRGSTLDTRSRSPGSFTGRVLRRMRPLKSLSLRDEQVEEWGESTWGGQEWNRWASVPASIPDLLDALHDRHHNTLEHLTIELSGRSDTRLHQNMLMPFMAKATSLKTLRLDVEDCDTKFLEHLPQSLQSVYFTLHANKIPGFGEGSLNDLHSQLPQLKNISYNVCNKRSGKSIFSFESKNYGRSRCE